MENRKIYNKTINIIRKLYVQGDINRSEAKSLSGLDEENFQLLFEKDGEVFIKTSINGAWLIKPKVFKDARGFFMESYSKARFGEKGISAEFMQDNHSLSVDRGVLRGLHFQTPPKEQAKLVRATKGSVYDVIVDLRKDSSTYGKWEGFTLSEKNFLMLFVPRGFAHGFCTLENNTEFIYKVDEFYSPENDSGIIWNDPTLKIKWPIMDPILSDKDRNQQSFINFKSPF